MIKLIHKSLPAPLYFSGYLSEAHFLAQNEGAYGMLVVDFWDLTLYLPTEECQIAFK